MTTFIVIFVILTIIMGFANPIMCFIMINFGLGLIPYIIGFYIARAVIRYLRKN